MALALPDALEAVADASAKLKLAGSYCTSVRDRLTRRRSLNYAERGINKAFSFLVRMTMDKLSSGLTGIAGEYFVAAELSRRGFMASITLRNNDGIDIHASRLTDNKIFAIQVKTTQIKGWKWPLSAKAEKSFSSNHFYIFVNLNSLQERPDYFIVPSEIVAKRTHESHQLWLNTPGKKGQPHNDSSMRIFEDKNGDYLEKWNLLH